MTTTQSWSELDGGSFLMGNPRDDGYPQEGETPVREVTLSAFAIAPYPVTNSQFADFVQQTGYCTDAEEFGWSFVFTMFLPADFEPARGCQPRPNGSSRRAAASTEWHSRGATNWNPAISTG